MDQTTPHERHAFEPRVEDDALLRGLGRFVEDAPQENQAHGVFVRSPYAHANIKALDVEGARAAKGVVGVLTHRELDAAGVGSCSVHPPLVGRNGTKLVMPFRPVLARDGVVHGGQPVALVVAETLAAAQDAAELVAVDYEELPAVADVRAALEPSAPQLFAEAPRNVALDWPGPVTDDGTNTREIEAIFASAAHVARVCVVNQRLVVASMEPRGATARYDAAADLYTLRSCSQGVYPQREQLIAVMGLPREKIRIITEDVGGAFGLKTPVYPEYPALLIAAKLTGRPVAWMASRAESFLTDQQARDTVTEAELALDAKGKFLALRVKHIANMGAFIGIPGANIQTMNFSRCFPGMYAIPRIEVGVRCVFTNTVPTGPYRGAGRPEANYALERVVAEAARITGIDPVKLRRRNLIRPKQIPYKTAVGTTFDSGDFEPILDKALALADYETFKQRRRDATRRGKLRGIGLSCFLEHAGALPTESASLLFEGERLVLGVGVGNTGQGHATIYPRLIAEKLNIPVSRVGHRHGDTNLDLRGNPSVGSRSTMTVGAALYRAVDLMLEKAKPIAAGMLEAADADVSYRDGHFEIVGTDRRVALFEVATHAKANGDTLDTKATVDTPQTFPNGCHIAEVEIDPDTGAVKIAAYAAVDDAGVVLDHTLVSGQLVGALAQGIGQALMENAVYDNDSGQLVTGTFMDYAMPRAEDMPPVAEANHNARATTNPLGVKGVGEAGTTGSIAAIMNAIADAIPDGRGNALDMPATAEKIWRACNPSA
ncbi:MAG: aerobic carbon-monoxide dehydrogenase large subunit [Hyphomicrobiales bacterium]|nr:aerobic carbon-monoxide dehydrogenase large subunit [Hyphomicrobiales bacterium]